MWPRADSHIHLFKPGYSRLLPPSCRRIAPDELTLYRTLAAQHHIGQALVIGYEGEPWALGNNGYISHLAHFYPWIRPVAYVEFPERLDVATLQAFAQRRFVGISLYIFHPNAARNIASTPHEVWEWIVAHRWLVSVNSRGDLWDVWSSILEKYPGLRLLISHMGLPPQVSQPPAPKELDPLLSPVLALADYPGVHVKLSCFYAIAQPDYAFPHRPAWPYIARLVAAFGLHRLIWGSDFAPCLESVSFPQAVAILKSTMLFSDIELSEIEGRNLLALLDSVVPVRTTNQQLASREEVL
jgi:L-fuconolactonase